MKTGRSQKIHRIIFASMGIAIMLVMLVSTVSAGSRHERTDLESRKKLAEYLNISALNLSLNNHVNTGMQRLYEQAYALDPDNGDVKMITGAIRMFFGDSLTSLKGARQILEAYSEGDRDRFWASEAFRYLNEMKTPEIGRIRLELAKRVRNDFPDDEDILMTLLNEYMNFVTPSARAYADTIVGLSREQIALNPRNFRYYLSAVKAYMLAGQSDSAKAVTEDFARNFNDDADMALMQSQIWKNLGDTAKAQEALDLAVRIDSTNGNVWMARGDLYLEKGDSLAFASEAFHALKSSDIDAESKAQVLLQVLRNSDRLGTPEKEVEELMQKLIEENPTETDFPYIYAVWLDTKERYGEAADYMMMVADNDSMAVKERYQACVLYNRAGNYKRSIEIARKARKEYPDAPAFLSSLVMSYWNTDSIDSAIDLLANARLDTMPDEELKSEFMLSLGDLYMKKELEDSAFVWYQKSVEANPYNYLALNNYAYQLSEMGKDLDKAAEMSLKTVKYEPENPTYLDTYAWILFKQIKYPEAKEYIDRTLAAYLPAEYGIKADTATVDSMAVTDIIVVEDSIGANPSDSLTVATEHTNLKEGMLTDKDKEYEAEFEDSEEDFDNPDAGTDENDRISAEVYEHAGDIYFMNQLHDQALEFWKKGLELEPDNPSLKAKVKHRTYLPPKQKNKR